MSNTRWSRAVLVGALLGLAGMANGAALNRQGDAKVSFTGKGTVGFSMVGTTDKLDLKDDGKDITFVVPLETLSTGIELRDRHMKEKYLQVKEFPTATLVVPRAQVQWPAEGEVKEGTATGRFTLHGVTREVPVKYKAVRSGGVHTVTSTMLVNFKDYGVSVPSYLGVTVKPDVAVDVAFQAQET
jgi:polyisoprenoid-binding protein YceI